MIYHTYLLHRKLDSLFAYEVLQLGWQFWISQTIHNLFILVFILKQVTYVVHWWLSWPTKPDIDDESQDPHASAVSIEDHPRGFRVPSQHPSQTEQVGNVCDKDNHTTREIERIECLVDGGGNIVESTDGEKVSGSARPTNGQEDFQQ